MTFRDVAVATGLDPNTGVLAVVQGMCLVLWVQQENSPEGTVLSSSWDRDSAEVTVLCENSNTSLCNRTFK